MAWVKTERIFHIGDYLKRSRNMSEIQIITDALMDGDADVLQEKVEAVL